MEILNVCLPYFITLCISVTVFLAVNYQEYGQELSGHVSLIGRIKSHPDVAERHYSQLFKKYFGNGMPQNVCV